MKKQNEQNRKTETQKCLLDVMKKINSYWSEEFEAELCDDEVLFPSGRVWICENCNQIHVGFFLGTSADFIGRMAVALSEYGDRLEFDDMPVYFDDSDEIIEGADAYTAYAKSLVVSGTFDNEIEALMGAKKNEGTLQ